VKLLRPLLIGLAALVVLLGLIIALAFLPPVQTWLARRALARQPGLNVTLGRFAAGLHGVELDEVRVEQPGLALTLPSFTVDLPLLRAVQKKVLIHRLVMKGWTLDLAAPVARPAPAPPVAAAPAATAVTAFRGIFQQLHLPVNVTVDSIELSGDVIFPVAAGQPPGRAHVTLTGGRLAPGQQGKFDFKADVTLAGSAAAVRTLAVQGSFTATLDTPRTFSQLELSADSTATGPQFPQGAHIHIDAGATRTAAGEHYTVALDADGKHLFSLQADYPTGTHRLAGSWQLAAHDTELAPFALGHVLPAFEALGEGKVEADDASGIIHATGRLHVSAEHLEAVRAELQALGRLTFDSDFDLTQNAAVTRVDHLAVTIAGAQPVAEVHALQAFEFNAKTGELKVADPTRSLLGVELKGVPLAWARPFLSGFAVSGSDVTGALQASARDGGLHLESSAPVEVNNFTLAQAGKPLLRLDRATLGLNADYTPQQGWQAELQAGAQSGSKPLFTLQTKAGCRAGAGQPIKATGQFQADLPAVLAQPALASLPPLTAGEVRVEFQASLGDKKEVEAKLSFAKLAAPAAPSLPTVTADVRAEFASDGKITLNAPVVLENAGRKSDLALSGTLQSGGGLNIDARIASDLIVADDFKALAPLAVKPSGPAPAPPSVPVAAPPPPPETARDTAPFWKGVNGHLVLALKKVVYGQFEVDDIAGDLKLGPDAITLDRLRAALSSGGTASLAGAVNFAPAAPEPYTLKANVNVSNLDTAPLFRALDPSKPPTVEGKFNLTGQAVGDGVNVMDLSQHVQGDGSLDSKSGIFRGLAKNTTTSAVSGMANLAGAAAGSKELVAVGKITDALKEFPYDQINIQVSRDPALNVQLKDFSVISQELRITGTGTLTYEKAKPVLDQQLALQIQIGVRDNFETLFNVIRKVSADKDDLGYSKVSRPIKIGGTPTNPDTSDLYVFLAEGLGTRAIERYLPKGLDKLKGLFGK